jgi:hypothetical protein
MAIKYVFLLLICHGLVFNCPQCMMEGLGVNFLAQTPLSANSIPGEEVQAQVCI